MQQLFSGRQTPITIALLLTALALVTRCYGIGQWDVIYDEYFTVSYASERWLSRTPAYYGLVVLSYKIFGVSEFAARLPALIFGVAAVPVFFWTWRSEIGEKAAAFGAILIIFSAWHLWYSQFSRYYSALFLLGSLCYYLYLKALRADSARGLFLSLGVGVVASLFHASAAIALTSCAVFSAALLMSPRLRGNAFSLRIVRIHLLVSVVGLAIAVPVFLWMVGEMNAYHQFWGYGPAGAMLQFAKWMQIPIAACAVVGIVHLLFRRWRLGLFVAISLGFSVLAYLVGSAVTTVRPDYIFASIPLVFVAAGQLCAAVQKALYDTLEAAKNSSSPRTRPWVRYLASQALLIVVVLSLMPEFVSYFSGRATLHMRQPAQFVEGVFEDGDRVLPLVNLFNSFHDYTEQALPREPRLGDPLDPTVDWPQKMAAYRTSPHCVWIVLPIRRQPLADSLERWLLSNARLVWRRTSNRFDYKVEGYQVFVTGDDAEACVQRAAAR